MVFDPAETAKLGEAIAEGSYYGMQTFDQALLKLHMDGLVSMDEALKAATHPHDFKLLVAAGGQRSTSVEAIYNPGHSQQPGAPPGTQSAGDENGAGAGNSGDPAYSNN
jgi:twitching motility protein PilT